MTVTRLKSAPGLSSSTPDPSTVPIFTTALHKAVDPATPQNLKNEMEGRNLFNFKNVYNSIVVFVGLERGSVSINW